MRTRRLAMDVLLDTRGVASLAWKVTAWTAPAGRALLEALLAP